MDRTPLSTEPLSLDELTETKSFSSKPNFSKIAWNYNIYKLQTHPYNEDRDSCNEIRVPCNENRFFPVRKISQKKLCFHYRDGFAV